MSAGRHAEAGRGPLGVPASSRRHARERDLARCANRRVERAGGREHPLRSPVGDHVRFLIDADPVLLPGGPASAFPLFVSLNNGSASWTEAGQPGIIW